MNADVAAGLKDLDATLAGIEAVLDLDRLRAQVAELQEQVARPDLWDDVEHAQQVNSRLSHKQGDLRRVLGLRQRLEDDTDALSAAPWQHLGAAATERVVELGKALSRRLVEGGAYANAGFAGGR